MQQWLRDSYPQLKQLNKCLLFYNLMADNPEPTLKQMFETRLMISRQMTKDGSLADQVTITKENFHACLQKISSFVSNMTSRINQQPQHPQQHPPQHQQQHQHPQHDQQQQERQQGGQAQQQILQQPPQELPHSKQAQLNAANLKIVEEQESHHRQQESQHRQHKAPPPPTTDRPPFQLGAQSPRGAPQYFQDPQVNAGNLKFPTKKKAKLDHVNSQTSTPGTTSSPKIGAGKGASPELKRPQQPEKPVETKPTFKCKDNTCDFSIRGFDTQAELEAHTKDSHAKIEDPLKYAIEQVAEAVGLNKDGNTKPDANATNRGTRPATATSTKPPHSGKSGQTPNLKQEVSTPTGAQAAATPMARVATQSSAVKSSPSNNILKTPQTGTKAGTPSTGQPARGTPASTAKPASKDTETAKTVTPEKKEEDPWATAPFDPTSLKDIFDAMDLPGTFTAASLSNEDNSWISRSLSLSPATTPASSLGSKDSTSTRDSDISESDNLQISLGMGGTDANTGGDAWMGALGTDFMPLDLQLSEDLRALGVGMEDEDVLLGMLGPIDGKGDADAMDMDWDATFGARAGLEAEGEIEGWGAGGVFDL